MQDDIQILREALAAGPTPGPWQHINFSSGAAVTAFAGGHDERGPSIAETGGSRSFVVSPGVGKPDAAYIAACSPDRMERLLARLEAAERLLTLARPFIERARHEAEARHDDPTGDLYMEASMYAIMQEADAVLAAMKAAP